MQDAFGRRIDYLRVSVTDRCDLRCSYCMNDETRFVERKELLALEELLRLCDIFIGLGVAKLRVTGGEPLVRRNVEWLFDRLGERLGQGLQEVALTTNATQLAEFAPRLAKAGVKRVNVSLDTLDAAVFRTITRHGDLSKVVQGIESARGCGLKVKLNCVLMKDVNEHEIPRLMVWGHKLGCDLVLIETMPMGDARSDRYLPLETALDRLSLGYHLQETDERTNGPARYFRVLETGGRLGVIAPLSRHFCETCNRVRLTSTGRLHLCLGREDGIDLREALRSGESDQAIEDRILKALAVKPQGHDFVAGGTLSAGPGAVRAMSATGG
ncbi:MAG: GTP 3',8-cyclase MoaA [Rhodospirillales bacterium]|nr:GTP 3',8-cyclase MoaA [Rhodospirillales bacterium]